MLVQDRNAIESATPHISHAGSRALFRHWEALRAERACPDRNEITFAGLANVIGNVAILDRAGDGTWQYRLAGTTVCKLLGRNVTGKGVLTAFNSFESEVIGRVLNISEERLQPGLMRMRLVDEDDGVTSAELLILPVLNGATGKAQLICGLFELSRSGAETPVGNVHVELFSARLIWTEHQTEKPLAEAPLNLMRPIASPKLRVIEGGLKP